MQTNRLSNASPATVHRDDIQGLRALAVVLVALGHAGVAFLPGGYVGVDVFFVLSGFLITGLLLSQSRRSARPSLVDFYARRARRILPAACLTLLVTDVVAYTLLNFVRARQVLHDSIPASLFVANFHFASSGTDYFAQGQPPSPIQHFWSLAVEEQFYLAWPLILLLIIRGRTAWRGPTHRPVASLTGRCGRTRLAAALALICGASFVWSIFYTHTHAAASYFSTLSRAWELGLGAVLAVGALRVERVPEHVRTLLGWAGLAAIAVAAVTYSSTTPFPGAAALLPTVGAALVIASGIRQGPASRAALSKILSLRPLGFVGDRSYAFYLWHWPVLIIAEQYVGHTLSVAENLSLLAGAFALSIASYALIENPIRRIRFFTPGYALVLWPASIIAVLFVAGFELQEIDVTTTRLASASASEYPGYLSASTQAPAQDSVGLLAAGFTAGGSSAALPAVMAAVARVERRAPLPAALDPPVSDLLSDRYDPPPGCAAKEGASSSTVCVLGDPAAHRSVAILGDSHAMMWIPALLIFARTDHLRVYPLTKSACTPSDWYLPERHDASCRAWLTWAQRQLSHLHPTLVLIAGDTALLTLDNAQTVSEGLRGLLAALKSSSPSLALLGDPPGPTWQPVDCLLSSGATTATCTTSETLAEAGVVRDMRNAAALARAHYIDVMPWFCYRGYCPLVVGNLVTFLDAGGHVTITYVTHLALALANALRPLISHG